MKWRKPDEMEQSHNLKSARNAFIFYTIALLIWATYDFIITGNLDWQVTILLIGTAIFWWSRVVLYKNTENAKNGVIQSKLIVLTIFYLILFLAIIFLVKHFFQ